jgi:PAS domain-containing protein
MIGAAPDFRVRALEIHSSYVWDFDWITKALEFVHTHGMTALVLHRNDIVDRVTSPISTSSGDHPRHRNIFTQYQYEYRAIYEHAPVDRSGTYNRRDYLKRIVDLARRWDIDVFLENKELHFADVVLRLNPQLRKDGVVCPNEPFWWTFIHDKYANLLADIPGIAGIITAPATRESRLSIAESCCQCELCRNSTPQHWFKSLIEAMHGPIRSHGKLLAIRDFVLDQHSQTQFVDVLTALPGDIVVSFKNTPHDYYPTFPDNPRLGLVGQRRQWIEYDVMGQYFGWGVAPSAMVDDLRRRLSHGLDRGVEGVVLRTDWESLDAHGCFHTPNLVNLYAGAMLAADVQTPGRAIYQAWLLGEGKIEEHASPAQIDQCVMWAQAIFEDSWSAIRGALYCNGCVFSDSSTFPLSADHAWWLAEEKNSLQDWDPSKRNAMELSESNVLRMLAEKDAAVECVERMQRALEHKPLAFSASAYQDLVVRLDILHRYIRAFRAFGHAIILTRFLVEGKSSDHPFFRDAHALLADAMRALVGLVRELREFHRSTDHRYVVYLLLSWERLEALHEDLAHGIACVERGNAA